MKIKKTYKNQLPCNMEVKSTNVRIEDSNLFIDIEFEKKYIPKFGDIVKVISTKGLIRDYMICIMPNREIPKDTYSTFYNIFNINKAGQLTDCCGFLKEQKIVPASDSEKQELFDKLAEVGKKWNPVSKQIENIRWIPKQGEEYWFINENFNFKWTRFNKFEADDLYRVDHNNCFKTEEAAKKVAKQMKEILKNSKAE